MQYNIHMQRNNVTFCMSNTLSQDINTCVGNTYILPEDIIYILYTCDIFAAYKKTKYSLCVAQMYKFRLFCYIASHILLVYIFTHIHTFV